MDLTSTPYAAKSSVNSLIFSLTFFSLSCTIDGSLTQQAVYVNDLFQYADADSSQKALALIESVPTYARGPADSAAIAGMMLMRTAHLYHTEADTVAAAFAFMKATPWLPALPPAVRIDHMRRYGETLGEASVTSANPAMLSMAMDAFHRATFDALAVGDSTTRKAITRSFVRFLDRLDTLPDSTRKKLELPARNGSTGRLLLELLVFGLIMLIRWSWKQTRSKRQPSEQERRLRNALRRALE